MTLWMGGLQQAGQCRVAKARGAWWSLGDCSNDWDAESLCKNGAKTVELLSEGVPHVCVSGRYWEPYVFLR